MGIFIKIKKRLFLKKLSFLVLFFICTFSFLLINCSKEDSQRRTSQTLKRQTLVIALNGDQINLTQWVRNYLFDYIGENQWSELEFSLWREDDTIPFTHSHMIDCINCLNSNGQTRSFSEFKIIPRNVGVADFYLEVKNSAQEQVAAGHLKVIVLEEGETGSTPPYISGPKDVLEDTQALYQVYLGNTQDAVTWGLGWSFSDDSSFTGLCEDGRNKDFCLEVPLLDKSLFQEVTLSRQRGSLAGVGFQSSVVQENLVDMLVNISSDEDELEEESFLVNLASSEGVITDFFEVKIHDSLEDIFEVPPAPSEINLRIRKPTQKAPLAVVLEWNEPESLSNSEEQNFYTNRPTLKYLIERCEKDKNTQNPNCQIIDLVGGPHDPKKTKRQGEIGWFQVNEVFSYNQNKILIYEDVYQPEVSDSIEPGKTYFYRIRSANVADLESGPSSLNHILVPKVSSGPPVQLQIRQVQENKGEIPKKINLTWNEPLQTGGHSSFKYAVEFCRLATASVDLSDCSWNCFTGIGGLKEEPCSLIEDTTGDNRISHFLHPENIVKGVLYEYRVFAVTNGEGCGVELDICNRSEAAQDSLILVTYPSAPQQVAAQLASDGSMVNLHWQLPEDTGGSDIVKYTIERCLSLPDASSCATQSDWTEIAHTGVQFSFSSPLGEIPSSLGYFYRVRAQNQNLFIGPPSELTQFISQ